MEANKKGSGAKSPTFGGGYGSGSNYSSSNIGDSGNYISEPSKPSYASMQKSSTSSTAMKLGGKSRDIDSFVDQLKEEGETVVAPSKPNIASKVVPSVNEVSRNEPVHLKQEEKLNVKVNRDGGVQSFELHGLITLNISDEKWGRIRVQLDNKDARGIQVQTHPNVDKELFRTKGQIGLKVPSKPFPLHTDVGVLKWRLQGQDESALPISINCWPSENGDGGCDVNIEYELEQVDLELNDVHIIIPLPIGANPVVSECDGQYLHDARKNTLTWSLPLVDSSNKSGSMEFAVANSNPSAFFPLHISFKSETPYAKIKIKEVMLVEDNSLVKHSVETVFFTDNYEVV